MAAIEHGLESLVKEQRIVIALLDRLFQAEQAREAGKVAESWRGYYVNLDTAGLIPILGYNKHRAGLTIINNGPSDVILTPKSGLDPIEAITKINQGADNAIIEIAYLKSGATTTVETKGPWYAHNVNHGGANPNAVLNILETTFSVPDLAGQRADANRMGDQAAVFHGHQTDDNGHRIGALR